MRTVVLILAYVLVFSSCSNDDDDAQNDKLYTGTLQRGISCTDDENELIFEIKINNHPSLEIFAVPELPDQYKTPDLQLTFKIDGFSDAVMQCVLTYGPDYFYRISDIRRID